MTDQRSSDYGPREDEPLTWEVVSDDARTRLCPIGSLDLATVPALKAKLHELRTSSDHLTVDLRRLEFMDSSGLRLLLELAAEAQRDGFSISLIRGPSGVQRVFEVTGTTAMFSFEDE